MKHTLFRTFALALLMPLATARAAEEAPPATPVNQDEYYSSSFGDKPKNEGHSIAPVIGYDPTFGFVAGAAYFYQGHGLNFGVDGNLNFRRVYQTHARFSFDLGGLWRTDWNFGFIKGFENYYGEGGETSATPRQIWGNRITAQGRLLVALSERFSAGVIADARSRDEERGPDVKQLDRVAPDATVVAMGLSSVYDTRKDKLRSNDGFVFTSEILHGPPQAGHGSFTQLGGSFVVYKEILEGFIPDVVAAFRIMGGVSLGDTPYAFRYQLGGPTRLSGYLENRFRGSKFFLQQTELRFPIYKMVGGALSLGFGDASDGPFTNPKMAYGAGLRIGLPPDWVSKIRIDVGVGKDQIGIFADFGQTF
ncbi:hypothetical protein K2X33_05935 [bacterium]|nr:hypothetical protein [bacterium]